MIVSDAKTLFQKPMRPTKQELDYHPLEVDGSKLKKAEMFCGEVSIYGNNLVYNKCQQFLFYYQHQPCIYDFLATGDEEFTNHTKNDFSGNFVYIGDII